MMDAVAPGGVAVDLNLGGRQALRDLARSSATSSPGWSNSTTTRPRCRIAPCAPACSTASWPGGSAAAASSAAPRAGRSTRAATTLTRPMTSCGSTCRRCAKATSTRAFGCASARSRRACGSSTQILDRLPAGRFAPRSRRAAAPGEGHALVEGFRGDVFVSLRLAADGRIARCHLRDPSWFQWPLLEAAIEGNIVADFPICNKSFNCSYSGHDL